jgi:hypothetical protein
MAVDALSTRSRTVPHNRRSGGYDRNPIAFEDGDLRLIQGGLGQVIESLDGVDRKSRGQPAIPDIDPGRTVFVHPTSFPTAVFLLEREEGTEIHFVPDSNGRASEDTHGESQGIAF